MTQEIIDMAQECGLIGMRPHLDGIYSEALVAFANLVAAKEREACAKLCDDLPVPPHVSSDDATVWDVATLECGDAIRARGQA
jgi:hypothetical protein